MPRQNIYYDDINDSDTGWRWRLELIPGYDQPLPATAVPAFDAHSRVGIYIPCPVHMIFRAPEHEEGGYDERPVGALTFPTLKLGLDLTQLRGGLDSDSDGMTDLEDLGRYLTTQPYANGGLIEGRSFATSMLWVLTTDRGDAALDVESFHAYFEGVQRKVPVMSLDVDRDEQSIKLNVDLVHLGRLAPELVLPVDVATRLLNSSPVAPKTFSVVYELLYQDSGASFAHTREGPPDSTAQQIDIWRHVDLWYTIVTCIEDVMKAFTRQGATFASRSVRSTTISGRAVGSPLDVFIFYKQYLINASGMRGNVLTPDQLWIAGRASYKSNSQAIGGFLHDDGSGQKQESLFRWNNIWDFFGAVAVPSKLCFIPLGRHSWEYYWAGIQESPTTALAINADNFLERGTKPQVGQNTIRGASVETAESAFGTIAFSADGLQADAEQTIKTVFTNLPDNSPAVDQFRCSDSPTRFHTSHTFIVSHAGYRSFGLLYVDTPGGTLTSSEICIRPHHFTAIDSGGGYNFSLGQLDTLSAPTIPAGSYNTNDFHFYQQYIWVPIKANYDRIIRESGTPWVIAAEVTKAFYPSNQTLYTETLSMEDIWWWELGNIVSATSWPNGSIYLWPDAYWYIDPVFPFLSRGMLDAIPGRPHVLRAQDNPGAATTKIEFLAQGS